jgi:hypothetical protein
LIHGFKINTHFTCFTITSRGEYRHLTVYTSLSGEKLPGLARTIFVWLAIHSFVNQQQLVPQHPFDADFRQIKYDRGCYTAFFGRGQSM